MSPEEARRALEALGRLPEEEIAIGEAALLLAAVDLPGEGFARAREALSALARAAVEAGRADRAAEAGDAEARREVLAGLLHGMHGFAGDEATYDDPANASLIRVLERRRGLPVALGILWLHCAEALGWEVAGTAFPGHFLLSVAGTRGRRIVDPFGGGAALEAADLRALLKRMQGARAELRPDMLRPVGRREVLLRLQNNLKLRRLRAGDMAGALAAAEDMLRIAPDAAPLWREAALMNQRLERIGQALACIERFLALAPSGAAAAEARALAKAWRARLN
ncbi:MAG: transglutaminase-like domain-containing protein [Acetobacteraceae bacterium]|nr:transglutaminase-like domain-containing protein [Acetobacteraceae bacterium]MDW8398222.1 transglutaminase-like domain-containing protein [Acetobacteraceae bacterium]